MANFAAPTVLAKPGQKGGDVKFARAVKDIGNYLKQADVYVTTFVDYYGLNKDWPGMAAAKSKKEPAQIADALNEATKTAIMQEYGELNAAKRFIPYVAVHEYEALLFSSPDILAKELKVRESDILKIINECGEPEKINDSVQTAPSKRIISLCKKYENMKTITGVAVAKAIGIEKMREKCPIFSRWLTSLENLR
ncbi:MAG: hypothetical protein GQF41_0459 [Candidatus Rifleibacterium amylolyticum]|nr:MAG: hypothetical protein GQF41_0459 [Candidatus Rifleibacterium amylolyticum]